MSETMRERSLRLSEELEKESLFFHEFSFDVHRNEPEHSQLAIEARAHSKTLKLVAQRLREFSRKS